MIISRDIERPFSKYPNPQQLEGHIPNLNKGIYEKLTASITLNDEG